ncbi:MULTISPECIES: hypothetical protein [Rodentibacter]|uniref:hypothetical protein n=1 Tax=Rodentibacter TaxID=1960084 RepID=UPI0010945107|nr:MULTISPECIES: hypothetical protein [Pasteurellaceae]MCR1837490.1 hypothetical protein [Pasteurella caecimuris]MCU0107648.1 hypothetical protein [Pasteurella caecimuris]NBH76286.1 hypothetical protein [Rodentibacter pneumotropicus]TGY50733.1 hypothetical protein E5343_03580 [Pasteurella caecimuris]THA07196.1 hypothetical protein D3M73_03295 [Rodentibacter pneumotropicus]
MAIYYKDGFFNDDFGGFVPEDAVEISEEKYVELLNGQAEGKQIIADSTGNPILIEPQPSSAHELKDGEWIISPEKMTALLMTKRDSLMEQIDNHAATIYSQWTRFESEYRERKAVAEAYKAANYLGECSRYITDFAKRAGIDNKTATDLILMQAAGLEKLQVELANQRMRKYELKAPGLTLEQMQATYDDIIKQMDELMEAYKNG